MPPLHHEGNTIATDKEGYLKQLSDWSPEIAQLLAQQESIELTPAHWAIIELLRDFHHQYELSPAMRVLVKHVGLTLGKDKGSSLYLMQLFPPSPARIACKIAGLPRPTNCL